MPGMATSELTDREMEILEFEKLTWVYAGAKEGRIRDQFDLSVTRYLQILGVLIDKPAAWAYAPQLVKRLRSLRDVRAHQRSARRLPAS